MKKCFLMLLLIFIASGCKQKDLFITDIKEKAGIEFTFKADSLKGLVSNSSEIDNVLSYKNNLLLFDNRHKAAYLSDAKFNIIKKYELGKDFGKIFTSKISDVFLLQDTLFIGDDTYVIKKLDLTTGKVKSLPLKVNLFQNFPFTLFVSKTGEIITSFRCMTNSVKERVKGDYVWGSVFNPAGKQIRALASEKDLFEHDLIAYETAYYNEFDNAGYVCFAYSKNIMQLGGNETKHMLYTNKDWTKPDIGKNRTLSAFTMNYQKLVKYKNYFIIPALPEKVGMPARFVLYNSDFTAAKVIELKGTKESYWYNLTIAGDSLVVYSKNYGTDPAFYLYDLSRLGL